ncbi:dynamin family protein [Paenibacillus sediminis]|uniref:dynamin family protein n=1 Tax=Paenibacillus sediminis TaxID=664909 RepID=UPI001AE2C346
MNVQTVTTNASTSIDTILHRLEQQFIHFGDLSSAEKMRDLLHKQLSGELTIAFCGHFSAGKSSLINQLCVKKVLPSSPVPTSANVVAIRNGSPRAMITAAIKNEDGSSSSHTHRIEVSLDELEQYCRNGNNYTYIEVWDELPFLGGNGVLLDTPGVDSTDAAHGMATNSALHLADAVFYVMDYNHVQSETNLAFAKQLSEWGKPIYMIVNQIDKHREQELSFALYKEEVERSFEAWQVRPAGIIYVSVKQPEHAFNEWYKMKKLIAGLLAKRTELVNHSLYCSAYYTVQEHLKQYEENLQDELERLLEQMGGEEGAVRLKQQLDSIQQEFERLDRLIETERQRFQSSLDRLLENAHIMPAELRDAAHQYLESAQANFKVGFLFAGSKTEEEKRRRLNLFEQKLKEQVNAQMDIHVRNLLVKWGKELEIWGDEDENRLDEELPVMDIELITSLVNPNAVISNTYTLNYTAELRAAIMARYRRAALALADGLLAAFAPRVTAARQHLAAQQASLHAQQTAATRYAALKREAAERAASLQAGLTARPTLTPGILPQVSDEEPPPQPVASEAAAPAPAPAAASRQRTALSPLAASGRRQRLYVAAARLERAAGLLAPYPAMTAVVRGLRSRAAELAGGRFTVALFGAFSAGKSSFANALLGANVLPVSPHPTTAAINRIMAPEGEYAHGSASVKMKSREALFEDIAYSFSILELGDFKEGSWLQSVKELRPEKIHPAGRAHYSFLKAAADGWEQAESLLGESFVVDIQAYRSFVAEENKSCFVKQIDLYYSCDLTEQGIVLVDTPGADSIHARHTGVTFSYMKNADAIVFVTYYNHAFSQADRSFLMQLGRVKGSFALDKMFFIVNAADLASSKEELADVTEHVRTNLALSGIHSPQIFPLSSIGALDAKLANDEDKLKESGLYTFEERFASFAEEDLAGLAASAAAKDVLLARHRVDEWIRTAQQGQLEKEAQLQKLQSDELKAAELIAQLKNTDLSRTIDRELSELLFHVRQRLRFQMGDLVQDSFHPSILREDAGDLKKIFIASGRELIRKLSIELRQELLATTLRMERSTDRKLSECFTECADKIAELSESLMVSQPESYDWTTPELNEVHLPSPVDFKTLWPLFKNAKAFFEGDGKKRLREALEGPLNEAVERAVHDVKQPLLTFYIEGSRKRLMRLGDQALEQLNESIQGIRSSLQMSERTEEWVHLSEELAQMEVEITA